MGQCRVDAIYGAGGPSGREANGGELQRSDP